VRSIPDLKPSARPIFIIGAPRSGTSIMTWAVGQHRNIQVLEETNWIAILAVGGFLAHSIGSSRGPRTHLSNAEYPLQQFLHRLGEFADTIVHDCFEAPSNPKARWVDGTPLNTHFVWALSEMFPEALFVHNLRRPGDVATSLEGFDSLGAEAVALAEGLRLWQQHTESAVLAERALGARRVFRLRFERIAEDPEGLFRELFDFLGEDYCPDCAKTVEQRINSSQVEERRQANNELMLLMPEYLEASALYWRLQINRPVDACEETAVAALRTRFEDYCSERSLL
jgi:hypothetical protein